MQACQTSDTDPSETSSIADGGTEEMWIDTDGTPYLFYTGPPNNARYWNEFYLFNSRIFLVLYFRETKVFLECDMSAEEPIATTVGDTPPREILHYVSHHYYVCLLCERMHCVYVLHTRIIIC